MKRTTAWALVIAAVLAAAAAWTAAMMSRGFSTRAAPSRLEIALARAIRSASVPRRAKQQQNPWAGKATPEILEAARAHWASHCASCHGNDGSGNTDIGRNLYPKAPDMRLPETQNLSDGELYYIIRNGVRLTGMPAWGDPNKEPDEESWQLVLFIRHLPHMTAEEIERMKALNPKTDAEREEERQEQEFLGGGEIPA